MWYDRGNMAGEYNEYFRPPPIPVPGKEPERVEVPAHVREKAMERAESFWNQGEPRSGSTADLLLQLGDLETNPGDYRDTLRAIPDSVLSPAAKFAMVAQVCKRDLSRGVGAGPQESFPSTLDKGLPYGFGEMAREASEQMSADAAKEFMSEQPREEDVAVVSQMDEEERERKKVTVLADKQMDVRLARELLVRDLDSDDSNAYVAYGLLAEVVENAVRDGRIGGGSGEYKLIADGLRVLEGRGKEKK